MMVGLNVAGTLWLNPQKGRSMLIGASEAYWDKLAGQAKPLVRKGGLVKFICGGVLLWQ
jgi:hypothetical protein